MGKFSKEKEWINKKINSGVTREQLLNGVGSFSNKPKKIVMQKKGLTSKEYDKRYKFLSNVYFLLS